MASWEDLRRIAETLPEVDEVGAHHWKVRNKPIAWERPLRKADLEALGEGAPPDPILGVWVPDEFAKEALISSDPNVYFTTPHFDGYQVVLVQLKEIEVDELGELMVEAWLLRAPKRLAREYLDARSGPSG